MCRIQTENRTEIPHWKHTTSVHIGGSTGARQRYERTYELNCVVVSFVYHLTETLQCNTKNRHFRSTNLRTNQTDSCRMNNCQFHLRIISGKFPFKFAIIFCTHRKKMFERSANNHTFSVIIMAGAQNAKDSWNSVTHVQCTTKRICMRANNSFRFEVKVIGVWALKTLTLSQLKCAHQFVSIHFNWREHMRWIDTRILGYLSLSHAQHKTLTHTRKKKTVRIETCQWFAVFEINTMDSYPMHTICVLIEHRNCCIWLDFFVGASQLSFFLSVADAVVEYSTIPNAICHGTFSFSK